MISVFRSPLTCGHDFKSCISNELWRDWWIVFARLQETQHEGTQHRDPRNKYDYDTLERRLPELIQVLEGNCGWKATLLHKPNKCTSNPLESIVDTPYSLEPSPVKHI